MVWLLRWCTRSTPPVRYSYMILPANATASNMPAALKNHGGYTLVGSDAEGFRAATDASGKLLLGAVWSDELATDVSVGCWRVSATRACAFSLQILPNGTVVASASVPGADGGVLSLTVSVDDSCSIPTLSVQSARLPFYDDTVGTIAAQSGKCLRAPNGSLTVTFDLPSGDYVGETVRATCAPPLL